MGSTIEKQDRQDEQQVHVGGPDEELMALIVPQKGRVGEGDHGQPEEGLFGMTGWAQLSRPVLPGLGLTLGV